MSGCQSRSYLNQETQAHFLKKREAEAGNWICTILNKLTAIFQIIWRNRLSLLELHFVFPDDETVRAEYFTVKSKKYVPASSGANESAGDY